MATPNGPFRVSDGRSLARIRENPLLDFRRRRRLRRVRKGSESSLERLEFARTRRALGKMRSEPILFLAVDLAGQQIEKPSSDRFTAFRSHHIPPWSPGLILPLLT